MREFIDRGVERAPIRADRSRRLQRPKAEADDVEMMPTAKRRDARAIVVRCVQLAEEGGTVRIRAQARRLRAERGETFFRERRVAWAAQPNRCADSFGLRCGPDSDRTGPRPCRTVPERRQAFEPRAKLKRSSSSITSRERPRSLRPARKG